MNGDPIDVADADRVRLVIISNIGAKPMSKQERQRIAESLYGERQWTHAAHRRGARRERSSRAPGYVAATIIEMG